MSAVRKRTKRATDCGWRVATDAQKTQLRPSLLHDSSWLSLDPLYLQSWLLVVRWERPCKHQGASSSQTLISKGRWKDFFIEIRISQSPKSHTSPFISESKTTPSFSKQVHSYVRKLICDAHSDRAPKVSKKVKPLPFRGFKNWRALRTIRSCTSFLNPSNLLFFTFSQFLPLVCPCAYGEGFTTD